MQREAKAAVEPVRQRTQYSCMAASMTMCLKALGYTDLDEDQVNRVMGAQPMKGAAWEQALACAQHYGCRSTLTMPSTVEQLKAWTDAGVPVMIAWNPEGRPWSHASVVFDVDDDLNVYVADPNIPNPKETVRIVSESDFYGKWYEKFPDYLVRRPACAIEREITLDGQQVNILAGTEPNPVKLLASRTASDKTSDMPIRDNALMSAHQDRWEATGKAFGKVLAQNIQVPGLSVEDSGRSVMLNLGPLFGVRYFGLHFQFGGRTVPNARMPPTFSASFFPSFGGRQDWPNLPVKDLERDLNVATMKVLERAFAPFGRTKTYAGGSAAPGHGTTVYLDMQDQVEHAWEKLHTTGASLGRAVSQVIGGYAAEFKKNKAGVMADVAKQLERAQAALQSATVSMAEAKAKGDTDDADWYDMRRNDADLSVLRLTEQLQGMSKMAAFNVWTDPHKTPAGKPYPKSKWDALGRTAPFRWSTPATNRDGSFPEPWRVGDKDSALAWLKKEFPEYGDIYTDYDEEFRGYSRLWVGLRNNQDKMDHAARLQAMVQTLHTAGWPVMAHPQGKAFWLKDDIMRDALRGKSAKPTIKAPKTMEEKRQEGRSIQVPQDATRNPVVRDLIQRGQSGAGLHQNKRDFDRGHARRPKHPGREREATDRVAERFLAAAYSGNPDGEPIYDVGINHGENQALSGGWDIMKRLQDQYRIEQGHPPRDPNPRLALWFGKDAPAVAESPEFKLLPAGAMVNKAFIDQAGAKPEGKGFHYKSIYFTPSGAQFYAQWAAGEGGDGEFRQVARQIGAKQLQGRFSGQTAHWNANSTTEVEQVARLATRFVAAQIGGGK